MIAWSRYYCKHCGQVLIRSGTKAWQKSFCERTGKNVHIIRVKKGTK